MAVFKCKMCGGNLDFVDNSGVATCEYCGTKQTVPHSRDEIVTNLFNRANNLRLKCEFDKAEQIFEKILDTDNTDPEAHWGIVLCKYGVEYVEDPKTYLKIPTCHRTLYEAVLTDVNYLAAVDNADAEQKELYVAEAKVIDKLQKSILDIVNAEEPFDVFICYKETDEEGKRTIDSSIANDMYHQLTQEGFKVFYAPITLEDKLGHEYEPYIFAALNSAKVMLVVGTKPEYFNAVWVRNEWSRFIKLIKADRSKILVPCYRDMNPYDLPDEFAHLQAQDMGKIGFISDLIRGIKKSIAPVTFKNDTSTPVVLGNTKKSAVKTPIIILIFVLIVALIAAIVIPIITKNDNPTVEISSDVSTENSVIETKYFNLSVPSLWKDNYYVETTAGDGYDAFTDAFEYRVTVHEKSGYISKGSAVLFTIVLTSNKDYDAFANGEKIGEIIADREYYVFVIYPSDVQFDLSNEKIYSQMSAQVKDVINSMHSTSETYVIKLYSQDPQTDLDYEEPTNKQVLYVDTNGTEATVRLEIWENSQWKTVFTTEGTVAKNGACEEIYEGSQRTPAGTFNLGFAFGVNYVDTKLDYRYVNENTYWIDDPSSKFYNMWKDGTDDKDWNSAEALYSQFTKGKMRNCIVIEFNGNGLTDENVISGGGSVIFICGRSGELKATYGDVHISEADMITLLSLLDKSQNPIVTIS